MSKVAVEADMNPDSRSKIPDATYPPFAKALGRIKIRMQQ